uniref:HNH nuclease domain-containing protein n=1 Tax=viral metagenome TaxID=1070528 RepID=A0A6C0JC68_9ZZZZ|tara:strand:+ start:568 stop:1068 length:501 start_codon:yes stop_codon:yes gene_type:complete
MKRIIINGKRNIEKIKGEKGKRKVTENIDKNVFDKLFQVEYLNKLYLEENFNGFTFIKKEVERKITGYKNQDIKKTKLEENLITYEQCLEKLVISKLKCYYCKKECLLTYENVREESQWTLDRLDNSQGHNKDNVVICCLKCNLKRRTLDDKKFKFSKQMRIIKTF